MARPPTSKSRGTCKYYLTSHGCFAGDTCRFLHGDFKPEALTPFDEAKVCVYYAKGYCKRGEDCWFKHTIKDSVKPSPIEEVTEGSTSEDVCCICLEKPITYGLLSNCSHVFCIRCIRTWRDPQSKSQDVVSSGVTKKCPLCRAPSRFVTPSSVFFPQDHPSKLHTIETYKASMSRVPCRYFQQSKSKTPFCPFGKDCFYQHLNDDGTPHVFIDGVDQCMKTYAFRRRDSASYFLNHSLNILNMVFDNPMDTLGTTIDALRAGLPGGLDNEWDDESNEDREETMNLEGLELLADHMLSTLTALQDSQNHEPTPSHSTDNAMPSGSYESSEYDIQDLILRSFLTREDHTSTASNGGEEIEGEGGGEEQETRLEPPRAFDLEYYSPQVQSSPSAHGSHHWEDPRIPSHIPHTSRFHTSIPSASSPYTASLNTSGTLSEAAGPGEIQSSSSSLPISTGRADLPEERSHFSFFDSKYGYERLVIDINDDEDETDPESDAKVPELEEIVSSSDWTQSSQSPFITDGRGRVVWSPAEHVEVTSTKGPTTSRNASNDEILSPRIFTSQSNLAGFAGNQNLEAGVFMTDGRGRVIGSSCSRGVDAAVPPKIPEGHDPHEEDTSGTTSEVEQSAEQPSSDSVPRNSSLIRRVISAVFSLA